MSASSGGSTTQGTGDNTLASRIYRFAAAIAFILAVVPPVGYFWLSYQSQGNELQVESKLYAAFVTQVIRSLPDDWKENVQDLIEQQLTKSELPEVRTIIDPHGAIITRTQGTPGDFALTRSTNLHDDNGRLVGAVTVSHSLGPILRETSLVALGGLALGTAIFLILYLLPLRALKRTLMALREETELAQENEARLAVVIENATEGIITLSQEGSVESFNAAAETIFGYSTAEAIGRNASLFMTLPPPGSIGYLESAAKHRDGHPFPIEISVGNSSTHGVSQLICIVRDITERKNAEERLNRMANFDSLTKLPNRHLFHDRINQALYRAQRHKTLVALMFLDLDRFKTINDTLGHGAGDRLLQHVANMLRSTLRRSDTVARHDLEDDDSQQDGATVSRLGGDEFTVILEDLANAEGAAIAAQKIIQTFSSSPIKLGDKDVYASTSIGIAIYPVDDTGVEGLIKAADNAMYRAKELGRNNYQFFTRDLNAKVSDRFLLESELRQALERDEFVLHYQPKVEISSGEIIGAEALLRWQRPGKEMVSPVEFIPILEETGLIVPVGEWVLQTSCLQNRAWQREGMKPLRIAVNLSARQFMQSDLVERISHIITETGVSPEHLEVELTESILMAHTDLNVSTLDAIDALGVAIAIDDFGTGYSSLSYLKRFRVHTLKIDRSFIRDLADDQDDVAIANAIIALGNSLRLTVIAEGVETTEQLELLRSLGCHQAQGYLLGRPMPAEAFAKHLASCP